MILKSQLNVKSPEFAQNWSAMAAQVQALRTLLAQVNQGGGPKAQGGILREANCCHASASIACSTQARPSSRSASWPPMRSTAKTYPPRA